MQYLGAVLNGVILSVHDSLQYRVAVAVEHLGQHDWIFREAFRLDIGEYPPLPETSRLVALPGHFIHMSKKRPGQVAFTPSAEYGEQDRQVTLPISKYLNRYQTELGLSAPEMNDMIRAWAAREIPVRLYLARTEEDIVYAYTHGPESCMKHDSDLTHDPVRVYAGPDTGVLVMCQGGTEGELDNATILGRAVCRVERKEYVKGYTSDGFWAEQFEKLLTAQGWSHSSMCLDGARLLQIWDEDDSDRLVMPYIDGNYDCGEFVDGYVVLGADGFDCCDASGYVRPNGDDSGEECDCCGLSYDDDDLTTVECDDRRVCRVCLDEHYRYAYTGRYQEYVKCEDVYGEDADGDLYTAEGASYHNLEFPVDAPDTLMSTDDLYSTEDGNYYCDTANAEDDGYVYTVDAELIKERYVFKTHTEALDGKWVPDDDVEGCGYVVAEDGALMLKGDIEEYGYLYVPSPDPDEDDLLVSKEDLADYGYKIGASGNLEALTQGELEGLGYPPAPQAATEPQPQPLAA